MIVRDVTAVAAAVAAIAACGAGSDTASDTARPAGTTTSSAATPKASPTAPRSGAPDPAVPVGRMVLRWRMTGGLAGLGGPGSVPDFSLYRDGRAIAGDRNNPSPLALREYRLRPDALQRLLGAARAAGLERSRVVGPEDNVADGFILEIEFGAARTRITQPEGLNDPAVLFWRRLQPAKWPPGDQAGPARPYEPRKLALLSGELDPQVAAGRRAGRWPLERAAPLGRGTPAAGGICTVVAGADARTAVRLGRTAKPGAVWRSAGKVYSLRFRPLLPDETGCGDLARG